MATFYSGPKCKRKLVFDLTAGGQCYLGPAPQTTRFLKIRAQVHQCTEYAVIAETIMKMMYDEAQFYFLMDWSRIVLKEYRMVYVRTARGSCTSETFLEKVPFCNASRRKLSVRITPVNGVQYTDDGDVAQVMAGIVVGHERYKEELCMNLNCDGGLFVPDISVFKFREEFEFEDKEFGLMRCKCRSRRGLSPLDPWCTPSAQPQDCLLDYEKKSGRGGSGNIFGQCKDWRGLSVHNTEAVKTAISVHNTDAVCEIHCDFA
jgi:hypothetical protein